MNCAVSPDDGDIRLLPGGDCTGDGFLAREGSAGLGLGGGT